MVASARLLSEAGVEPAFGVVGARATKTQFDSMVAGNWKMFRLLVSKSIGMI
jgi:hypothetical protein